jgi:hypothetical protein
MATNSIPFDPNQVRTTAAQQAQKTTWQIFEAQIPKFKTEWIKDVQATLLKSDFQAATLSAQFFKMDHSVFKWDEKGLTFAGRPIGPGTSASLDNLVHGGRNKKKAEAAERAAQEEAKAAKEVREAEAKRVRKFEDDLRKSVDQAKISARHAKDDASKAQNDAKRADNLLRSANSNARLAADNASRASKNLAALEKRVEDLEAQF